jgi:hypothetical protein
MRFAVSYDGWVAAFIGEYPVGRQGFLEMLQIKNSFIDGRLQAFLLQNARQ